MKIKKKFPKLMSALLAVVMMISALPMSAFAAAASDLPANMTDHSILRALEYTGYDVQQQIKDGTLYQSGSYGSRTPSSVLSDISYGTSTSGKETVRYATAFIPKWICASGMSINTATFVPMPFTTMAETITSIVCIRTPLPTVKLKISKRRSTRARQREPI